MAETTADVRRDIELTRERMSRTIAELERKLNVLEVVREHPWPSIAVAAGAGLLLAGTDADRKAAGATAAATAAATRGASNRVAPLIDGLLARMLVGVQAALEERADEFVSDIRRAIGAPSTPAEFAPSAPSAPSPQSAPSAPSAFQGDSRGWTTSDVARPPVQRAD